MFNLDQPNYQRLRAIVRERTNPIVLWVGSGLSTAAKLPTWRGLLHSVCDGFRRELATLDPGSERARKEKEIQGIEASDDLWVSFDRLSDLGDQTYTSGIRDALSNASRCKVPTNYATWMKLGVSGVITTNLDRLAGRAFSSIYPDTNVAEFGARECGSFTHILKTSRPFVLNAHGVVDDKTSWVFRRRDLRWLLKDDGYLNFVRTCLCSRTLVFVGMSLDDIAIQSHFDYFRAAGIDMGSHYWVTDRSDAATDEWAEKSTAAMIRYSSTNDHAELGEMLKDLKAYLPLDPADMPPAFPAGRSKSVPAPLAASGDLMATTTREQRRALLNSTAKYLLRDENPKRYADYERFRSEYDDCIYDCWYATVTPPNNVLLGYTLKREVAEGAFGTVYEAESPDGRQVAVKLLKNEVRRKPEMLQSFRRGVSAMRILSQNHVEGMVPYTDSSEIPAFVVMDYIEGPNLKEAVHSGYLTDWHELLRFARELTGIIRRAHQVPQHVLHRDIRPANIMLKGYDADCSTAKVVVLDFDLSWYRDAAEVSISSGSTIHGYLAPEQIERVARVSTKNAAVDSFGLGMTLYFMRTGRDPIYMQHRHADWSDVVTRQVLGHPCAMWKSLPSRFAALILRATSDAQVDRCDVAQIEGELLRLLGALGSPRSVLDAELLCHELAYRCCQESGQDRALAWDGNALEARISLSSGVRVVVRPRDNEQAVQVWFEWCNDGSAKFKNVGKYLETHVDKAVSLLKSAGAYVEPNTGYGTGGVKFSLAFPVKQLATKMEVASAKLAEAVQGFRF